MFFSDSGNRNIESPNITTSEAHKFSGIPRKEISKVFWKMKEVGFIEKVPEMEYAYRIKELMTVEEIEAQINNA